MKWGGRGAEKKNDVLGRIAVRKRKTPDNPSRGYSPIRHMGRKKGRAKNRDRELEKI